ncbi:Hydantoinase B/oxoprolinase-domain-containing protein [Diplogelasinospora grovesii]|uniref:Hydantoinase B/oxoprolinase-domain-containing protein n=1 Tax=Diplogelasinospora grovesii TaxID=303347 RepID=A0AAN6N5L1_9PEZI|nr:Hydantoinase B/oxoprolinase-domain-containing protein [Diplogelasinospora grovesii]
MSIAEQMGRTLQKTSVSLNIKERLDFSCAIVGPQGDLVANAPHMPVNLGSMQNAVQYQHELKPGDVLVTNHADAGGTHLPDITVVTPVFDDAGKEIIFYTANPAATSLEQEGALIKSFKLASEGKFDEEGITKILVEDPVQYPGCVGSSSIYDNLTAVVQQYMAAIQETAEAAVRQYLKAVARTHPEPLTAVDYLDDGTEIHLRVTIDGQTGGAVLDFTGTDPETYGNRNAPRSLVYSAVIYALRAMINEDIPLNQGCLAPTQIVIPESTVLSPSCGTAVYTGNSLTSQLAVQMYGGDKAALLRGEPFRGSPLMHGETICGGSGAGPTWNGVSAVHTNMTNTRVSDLEIILEKRYPVLVRHSERRTHRPYGMCGGGPGMSGRNLALLHLPGGGAGAGEKKNRWVNVSASKLYIHTPGGGAWGKKGGKAMWCWRTARGTRRRSLSTGGGRGFGP